jgi:6,7-dimethyl-8-ribityllumazine synthase
MATPDSRPARPNDLDGHGVRVAIVRSRWHGDIVDRLHAGTRQVLDDLGVTDVEVHSVPGCFEIPLAVKVIVESRTADAVICLGAVIRENEAADDIVSRECARGVQNVQRETGVPVAYGVLSVSSYDEALAASSEGGAGGGYNAGEDAAWVAVEMARLVQRYH